MFPPTYRKAAVQAVRVGVGSPGWAAYRRVLGEIHCTFGDSDEMVFRSRNEARRIFGLRRAATGDDVAKCVEEADTAVEQLRLYVVPAVDDGKGGAKFNLNREQVKAGEGMQLQSPDELQAQVKVMKEQDERAVKGQRLRSFKAKVKCM
eukprot:TRINITY_DN27156_c0_g1_i1.p2 TRINITY_DN27156_c0_g1~~TRINITY_DN27156_c0_g1_i1.p2  ORF type:complete len:149 (+),score=56.91 TRINITY_DN27156_c0_g1_i1:52-498(+)